MQCFVKETPTGSVVRLVVCGDSDHAWAPHNTQKARRARYECAVHTVSKCQVTRNRHVGPGTCVITRAEKKRLQSSSKLRLSCRKKKEVQRIRLTCARSVTMKGDWSKAKKRWQLQSGESWSSRRPIEGSCGQLLVWSNSCTECGDDSPSTKLGPDRSWKMQDM